MFTRYYHFIKQWGQMQPNDYWLTLIIDCAIEGCFLDKITGSQLLSEVSREGLQRLIACIAVVLGKEGCFLSACRN